MAVTCYALALLALVALSAAHSEYIPAFMHKIRQADKVRPEGFVHRKNLRSEDQYFRNIDRLTNGGTNAEAYWSYDGKQLTFQAQLAPLNVTHPCDLIYTIDIASKVITPLSPPWGRDTCSYFTKNGSNIIYSSTMGGGHWCPAPPDQNFGYVWPLNKDMSIYTHDLKTKTDRLLLTDIRPGYYAESTISPDGSRIVFTADFEGDLELYTMNTDGSDLERMTYTPGYDGGPYFSNKGDMIVWRAGRPQGTDLLRYFELIRFGMVEPVDMQIYIMQLQGPMSKVPMKVTNNSGVSFAPFFVPGDRSIIFSSNMHDPMGGDFQLYVINVDGTGLKQVTTKGSFNSFAMFSFDGRRIAWCSNRDAGPGDYSTIDIYVADWVGGGIAEGSETRVTM